MSNDYKELLIPEYPEHNAKWRKPKLFYGEGVKEVNLKWDFHENLIMRNPTKSRLASDAALKSTTHEYHTIGWFEKWLSSYFGRPVTIKVIYLDRKTWRGERYIDPLFGYEFKQ